MLEERKKTLVIAVSAIVGITAISSLIYLLIEDDRKVRHENKVKSLQRSLSSKIHKVDFAVQNLIQGEIRAAKVRAHFLSLRPLHPGDDSISSGTTPSDLELTAEETEAAKKDQTRWKQADGAPVRQDYKKLDFLIKSLNERFLGLLETLDSVRHRDLIDLGNGRGGPASEESSQIHGSEKIRLRKRKMIVKIQQLMANLDKLHESIKARVEQAESYEKKSAEEKKKQAKVDRFDADSSAEESSLTSSVPSLSSSYAEVVAEDAHSLHSRDPQTGSAKTDDQEKMEAGISFADAVKHGEQHDTDVPKAAESALVEDNVSFADVVSQGGESTAANETVSVAESSLVEESVSYAQKASEQVDEQTQETKDLHDSLVKENLSFADIAATPAEYQPDHHEHSSTKDTVSTSAASSALVEDSISFAEVASHPPSADAEIVA